MNALTHTLNAARRPVLAMLRTRFVSALCEPRGVDYFLAPIAPTWSTHEIRARVVRVQREASDTVSLLLAPNDHWRGFRAGQHVQLSVTIAGVRHTRTFSISSPPRAGVPLRITIRAFEGGRVSGWALRDAKQGDVVVLSSARGDFVCDAPKHAALLFVSGGSGITPVASMLHELLHAGHTGPITCLHYARHEVLFADELTALARQFANFRFVPQLTTSGSDTRDERSRVSKTVLERVHPELRDSEAFVCGPTELERSVRAIYAEEGLLDRLHVERFRMQACAPALASEPRTVVFDKSGVASESRGAATLLEQAEAAGLRPAHGCRMGICHLCKCHKQSGVVRNTLTGEQSGPGEESIQLCISTPVSDVTLTL